MSRIFAAFVFLICASAACAQTFWVNSPGDGFLNLRDGPGGSHSIVMKMYQGSEVNLLDEQGPWMQVQHESGYVGWAHGDYLWGAYLPPTVVRRVYSSSDGFLNLRQGPGTGHPIILEMYDGETVQLLGEAGGWALVIHELTDSWGWASERFLTR